MVKILKAFALKHHLYSFMDSHATNNKKEAWIQAEKISLCAASAENRSLTGIPNFLCILGYNIN
jgi:hypothetical protein